MRDRAGNTLASARRLGSLDAKTLNFKDFVGSGDRDDLYTFNIGNSSSLNVNFSRAIAAELYTLKNRKATKTIGKTDFSNLKRKDIRSNLIRVARFSSGSVPQITAANLIPGDYYLRVRSLKNKVKYSLAISGLTGIVALEPLPTSNPNPVSTPGITTSLFNGTGLPKAQGWLDFNQIPTFFPINQRPSYRTLPKLLLKLQAHRVSRLKPMKALQQPQISIRVMQATATTPLPLPLSWQKLTQPFQLSIEPQATASRLSLY